MCNPPPEQMTHLVIVQMALDLLFVDHDIILYNSTLPFVSPSHLYCQTFTSYLCLCMLFSIRFDDHRVICGVKISRHICMHVLAPHKAIFIYNPSVR